VKPKSVQAIGKKFENWCNEQIEEMGLGRAIRTPGSGSGKYKGDSFNALPFLFENKSERRPNWKGNIRQAQEQARMGNYDQDKWILIQRDPESPQANPQAFAILDYVELLKLLKKNSEPIYKAPDREMKWLLQKAVDILKQIIKRLEK